MAENFDERCAYLEGIKYLTSLADLNSLNLIYGPCKTSIQGFAISAKSILAISKDLLLRIQNPYSFVLTYRFFRDPLEMLFSKIRGRLGWNNNPNALQFKYALRALLLHNNVESPSTANCISIGDDHDAIPYKNEEKDQQLVSHMLVTCTAWRPDVLFYTSGFIANKLCKTLKCSECVEALFEPPGEIYQHCKTTSFWHARNRVNCSFHHHYLQMIQM